MRSVASLWSCGKRARVIALRNRALGRSLGLRLSRSRHNRYTWIGIASSRCLGSLIFFLSFSWNQTTDQSSESTTTSSLLFILLGTCGGRWTVWLILLIIRHTRKESSENSTELRGILLDSFDIIEGLGAIGLDLWMEQS